MGFIRLPKAHGMFLLGYFLRSSIAGSQRMSFHIIIRKPADAPFLPFSPEYLISYRTQAIRWVTVFSVLQRMAYN